MIAAFIGLWAALNYEQMTSLFRVEQRSTAYVAATLANVAITITATILLVVVFDKGPLGVLVGNFTGHADRVRGTACSTAVTRSGCSSTARSTAR